jgi:hypothetical protein
MSTLVEKIQSFVEKVPMIQNGTKLTPSQAEFAIWKGLGDPRIGISKKDSDTHQLLQYVSEKDYRTVFCDENSIALPCVRALMDVLTKPETESAPQPAREGDFVGMVIKTLNDNRPIGQYKTTDLLEKYDADASQEIWEELQKRSQSLPCIIFTDGKVDIKLSNGLLQSIRKGEKTTNVWNDGEKVHRVYSIGVFPEEFALCCPITGKILNNGYCSDLGVSWSGISEECLVFIKIVCTENGVEVQNKFAAKQMIKAAKEGDIEQLRKDWPEEALVYDEQKKLGTLPSLRVSRNSMAAGRRMSRVSDPFGTPKRS